MEHVVVEASAVEAATTKTRRGEGEGEEEATMMKMAEGEGEGEGEGEAALFPPASVAAAASGTGSEVREMRKVTVPGHRLGALKQQWVDIFTPLVAGLKLQVRMNTRTRQVELATSAHTADSGALQRGADFVRAFLLGFEAKDAVALLRLDDLYVDTFEIEDVKRLAGDHLARAIGRIAGRDGRTKTLIENSTRTRIVLADKRVHILGSYANIKVAKDALVDLILGSPPGKVHASLRAKSARLNERW